MYRGTLIAVMALVAATVAIPLAGPGIAAADTGGPTITLRADGTTLTGGDVVRTTSNPKLDISATADSNIDVVSVRIDGETRRTFTPNDRTADYSFSPQLRSGTHELTVVVTAETTNSVRATITRDSLGPDVRFLSPFERDRDESVPDRVVLSNANVTLSGRVFDHSRIESIRVERTYRYDGDTVHDAYTPTPSGSFDQPLFLGYGTNAVTVTTRDELDNVDTHRVELVVRDNRAPTVAVTDVHWVSSSHVRIEGYAEDDVQLKSVAVGKMSVRNRRVLLATEDRAPDRSGRHVEFTGTVSTPSESLLISATDHSGKTTTRGVPIAAFAVPEIHLDESKTVRRDGAVVVEGVVRRGAVTDVTVETVSKSGEIVDVAAAYHGRPVETRIPFEARLDPADGRTTVRVRVLDATGTEHVLERTVGAKAPERTASGAAKATATAEAAEQSSADGVTTPVATASADAESAETDDAIRLELPVFGVGVTVPAPGALGFTLAVPRTGVSFDVPGVGVLGGIGLALFLGGGVVRSLRR